MKPILLSLLFMLMHSWLSAQTPRSLNIDLGMERHALQDYGQSPLQYTGNNLFFGLSTPKETEKHFSEFKLSYAAATLHPNADINDDFELLEVKRTTIRVGYHYLRKIKDNGLKVSVGGEVFAFIDLPNYGHNANNPIAYNLNVSVNPKVQLQYQVKDWLGVRFQTDFPLLGYIVRPNALGLFPTENLEVNIGDILFGGQIATFNKFFYLHTRTSFDFLTPKEKRITLFYDYYAGTNSTVEARGFEQHRLGLSFILTKKVNSHES